MFRRKTAESYIIKTVRPANHLISYTLGFFLSAFSNTRTQIASGVCLQLGEMPKESSKITSFELNVCEGGLKKQQKNRCFGSLSSFSFVLTETTSLSSTESCSY